MTTTAHSAPRGSEPIMSPEFLKQLGPARIDPDPSRYVADSALRQAVNVALALGMPLLLTGEPGTGKTQLAYRLAHELHPGRDPERFDTKSTSVATDLLYTFDSVRYFGRMQTAAVTPNSALPQARQYIHYRAFGLAILRTRTWSDNEALLSDSQAKKEGLAGAEPARSVVLIDEIDKAPRDFPNDLLRQLDEFGFDVPDLDQPLLRADKNHWPIVIITSNSERALPEAFLRRCVYHHIMLPTQAAERQAWFSHLVGEHMHDTFGGESTDAPGLQQAVSAYWALRDRRDLDKAPSTHELIEWLRVLHKRGVQWSQALTDQPSVLAGTLGVLLKTSDDLVRGGSVQPFLQTA